MQSQATDKMAVSCVRSITLVELEAADGPALDLLEFGVVRMDRSGTVVHYGAFESRNSGMSPGRVVGQHFFDTVTPCMNNFLVVERFATEAELDAVIDYVLTLRMRATKVRLRLLKGSPYRHMYLLVDRS